MTATDEGDLGPAELADLCEALVTAWHHDAMLFAGGPATASQADIDVAAFLEQFPEGVPGNLEHAPKQMAGQMVDPIVLLLQSVATQLRGEPVITLGLWPLVRAEIEYAGRVAWLLEPFPEDNAGSRRVARAMLEQLSGLQRQRFTAGKWNPTQAAKFKKLRDELLVRIKAHFGDVYTPLDSPELIAEWSIGGEPMAPLGRAAQLFLTLNFSNADAIYDVFSDNAHPSVISLALQSTVSDEDGVTIWTYSPIPRVVNYQARLACAVLYKSALMLLNYFGFPSVALEEWADTTPVTWFGDAESTT